MKCLQCGSERIVRNAKAADVSDGVRLDMKLVVYEDPSAMIFKGANEGTIRGNVCVDSGFVMFTMSRNDAKKLEIAKKRQGGK